MPFSRPRARWRLALVGSDEEFEGLARAEQGELHRRARGAVAQRLAEFAGPDTPRKLQLYGKMLRESRDTDVWSFTTPAEVQRLLPHVARRVGRRLPFWRFLIEGWVSDGLLRP